MLDALESGLRLVDASGYFIILTILVVLAVGIALTFAIRARYGALSADLHAHAGTGAFDSAALRQIASAALAAHERGTQEINTQVIIEQGVQSELRHLLIGERFLRSCTGLLIILGLVGTFYGLTLSIGKLAALIGGDPADVTEITETLTAGLTQALAGMSVAFSTSLFGIVSAIVMTLVSVFFNVVDRRAEVLGQIESYVDNVLLPATRGAARASGLIDAGGSGVSGRTSTNLDGSVLALGQTVVQLQGVVAHFERALQTFSNDTRSFQEFNLHLKDNVQRMSLSFGDLSDALKEHARAIKPRD
jgi:hypothetical protein